MTPDTTPPPSTTSTAELVVYDQNFDDLDERRKADTIVTLLETIPSISEMRAYLKTRERQSEPSLRAYVDSISPAALGLLRWIVASNRSCIVQVDKFPGQDADVILNSMRLDHKVSNMDGWVQFRFAQGAPDKELRFNKALQDTEGRHNKTYPTLFAWHGSGLENWHSIIRSGLDFSETINGRAFGHGVYHSLEYSVSYGYSGRGSVSIKLVP
jgi:ubiquitin-conjugating enzyme E2 Q